MSGTLSEDVRIVALTFLCIIECLTVGFATWVICNRKSQVVKQMQPQFLLLLCLGTAISALSMIPFDSSSDNVDSYCLAIPWVSHMGVTITLSALFSKLWRINQIFHAQNFHRKVVKVQDVLFPLVILLTLNMTFLIVLSVKDPPTWQEPGGCQTSTAVGSAMESCLNLVTFVALIILCIQAYRARDITSEFSEARGVALALFAWVQSIVIIFPTLFVLDGDNVDAYYTLLVTQSFVTNLSVLLFIFCPIIYHHRRQQKHKNDHSKPSRRITGIDLQSMTTGAQGIRMAEMEKELRALQAKIAELEASAADMGEAISSMPGSSLEASSGNTEEPIASMPGSSMVAFSANMGEASASMPGTSLDSS